MTKEEKVEYLKQYIKQGGKWCMPLYEDGEMVLKNCLMVGDDEKWEHIGDNDWFYQFVMDENGKIYRAYYDLERIDEEFKKDGFSDGLDGDFCKIDYEYPDWIQELSEWEYCLDDPFGRNELDTFLEFAEEYGFLKMRKDE